MKLKLFITSMFLIACNQGPVSVNAVIPAAPVPIATPPTSGNVIVPPLVTPLPSASPVATPVVPVIPSKTVVNISAGADLAAIFSALKANTMYVLAPKASYAVTGTFTVTAENVSINLNGSTLAMKPQPPTAAPVYLASQKYAKYATASVNSISYQSLVDNNIGHPVCDAAFWRLLGGSSSSFAPHGANLEIFNGHISKAMTFVHSYAPGLHLHDLTFANIQYAVAPGSCPGTKATWSDGISQAYDSDNNLAVHNTLENLDIGHTGTVSIYNTADDFTLKNSILRGSYGEYCFRSEITSDAAMHHPNNTLLDHVTCDNTINGFGKSCIGIRMGGTGMVIQNSSVIGSATTGYINLGQGGGATGVGSNVGGISLINNQFLGARMPQLEIDAGVVAIVKGNIFNTWVDSPNVAMATFSKVTFQDNIRKMIPTGTIPLKRFAGSNTNPPAVWTETGTIIK